MVFRKAKWAKFPARRVISALLIVMLLCTGSNMHWDSIARAIRGVAEGDPLSRIYSILQGEIDEPESFDDYYQLASIAIGQKDYQAALGHLDTCVELAEEGEPSVLVDVWLKKASLYMLMLEIDNALQALERVFVYDPDSTQALLLRAQIALEREDYQAGLDDMERYLELMPYDTSIWATLAQVYEALGRYEEAGECYGKLFVLTPTDESNRLNALRCQFLAGNYASALTGLDEYVTGLEQALTEANEMTEAQKALLPTAYFLRAACQMQLGGFAEAIADYVSAMEAGFDRATCLEQLVTCSYALEDYSATLVYGEQLLTLENASTTLDALYQRMGVAAMSSEQYDQAVRYLDLSIQANSTLEGNYYYRGVCLLSLGRYEEAVEDFTASIEQAYLTQFCYYNRGVCYVQLLDYESALEDMGSTLVSGDEATLKEAATDILWQLAQYYENQKLIGEQGIEAEQIFD